MQDYRRFDELLEALDIRPGDVVYLHSSFKRMKYLGLTGQQFLDRLMEKLGTEGTLVLPSFAWNLDKSARPWKGYRDYFYQPSVFDVRHTRANIGFLPELFRMMPGVRRSVNYWWPVCARGALAAELVAGQEKVAHPFGPGSSFDLLRTYGVKILGLGVSLNTTSLALIPDYVLGDRHTQKVFTDEPGSAAVIDDEGNQIETRSFWLLPDVVRLIKPSVLIAASRKLHSAVRRVDEAETIQFSYPYEVYHEEALRLGESACADGRPVPWLQDYPLKQQSVPHDGEGF